MERLALLSRVFSIDVASYAIMSNHYHVVLRVDEDTALKLNAEDFIDHVLTYEDKTFYPIAIGPIDKMKNLAKHWQQKSIKGQYLFQRIYSPL